VKYLYLGSFTEIGNLYTWKSNKILNKFVANSRGDTVSVCCSFILLSSRCKPYDNICTILFKHLSAVGYTQKGNVIAFGKRCLFFESQVWKKYKYHVHGGNKKQRKGNL